MSLSSVEIVVALADNASCMLVGGIGARLMCVVDTGVMIGVVDGAHACDDLALAATGAPLAVGHSLPRAWW